MNFARVFAVILLVLFLPSIAMGGTNSWTPIPGSDPNPGAIAVDPVNASIIYVGAQTSTGQNDTTYIRKTVDGGANWTTVFSQPASVGYILQILIDPKNSATIYAVTSQPVNFGAGVFRSTDGGANWSVRNFGLVATTVSVAIDPVTPATLYAVGSDYKIYKSTDAGGVWVSIYSQSISLYSIAIDPSNPSILYVGSRGAAILKSTNAGASWTFLGFPNTFPGMITIDPAATSTLYVASSSGIYKSIDGGATWNPANNGLDLYFGGPGWIVALPGPSTTLFARTFRGVFRSLDAGFTWAPANDGLPLISDSSTPATPNPVATSPAAPNTLFGSVFGGLQNMASNGIFTYTHDVSVLVPTCYLSATPSTIDTGASSTLSTYCSPSATSYTWSSNTGFSSSASGGTVSPTQTTTYTVQGVNANGSSAVQSVTVLTASPRLSGISTRGKVLTGEDVLIGGFIIDGITPKKVVIRARGPSLAAAGVTGVLSDPTLRVQRSGFVNPLATNDNWGTASNAAELQASGLAPSDAAESAILITLDPGGYTAIVSGVGDTTGVGIVEVYEVDHPETPMAAISTRGKVFTGDDVLIGGFIIEGSSPRQFVVRGRGPSLASAGILGALQNPTLEVFSGATLIASNDDWITDANAPQLQSSGFAPADQRESAILLTLSPGAYTVIVRGAGGTTGVAIVEMFEP